MRIIEEKQQLLSDVQSNPLKWTALGPDYEYNLSMFHALRCEQLAQGCRAHQCRAV